MTLTSVDAIELSEIFGGVPLSVVFAEGEALAAVREGAANRVPLEPPFHVSDDDVYLVLPADIGLELIDIFADSDAELLEEAMVEGLVVLGSIEREGRGRVSLEIEEVIGARDLLDHGLPYAAEIAVGGELDPLEELNGLDQAQVTVSSALIDDDGLEKMLRREQHIGASWRVPKDAKHLEGVDPTYAWSRRLPDGRVGIEAALFSEYEELVMLLRPAVLAPAAASRRAAPLAL
jgi:hypothetical protein